MFNFEAFFYKYTFAFIFILFTSRALRFPDEFRAQVTFNRKYLQVTYKSQFRSLFSCLEGPFWLQEVFKQLKFQRKIPHNTHEYFLKNTQTLNRAVVREERNISRRSLSSTNNGTAFPATKKTPTLWQFIVFICLFFKKLYHDLQLLVILDIKIQA